MTKKNARQLYCFPHGQSFDCIADNHVLCEFAFSQLSTIFDTNCAKLSYAFTTFELSSKKCKVVNVR